MRAATSRTLLAGAASLAVLALAPPTLAQAPPAEAVVVTYSSPAALERAVDDHGSLDAADPGADAVAPRVAEADLTPAEQAQLRHDPAVLAVEPDAPVYAVEVPSDPCYQDPGGCGGLGAWHVDQIGLPAAWDVSHGQGAVVAVVDTGVTSVPDLAGKLLPEINSSGGLPCLTGTRMDHGTEVAGLIAAIADNSTGIPGVGWDVQIRPVRVWAGQGPTQNCPDNTSLSAVLAGITAARDSGARIINISLTTTSSTALKSAIDDVIASGVVVVAAAGNSGLSDPGLASGGYPAAYPDVIAVGATCPAGPGGGSSCSGVADARASFSNFGAYVDVYAPGVALVTYKTTGSLVQVSGTSFASPVVAGVVALLRSVRPGLSPAQVQDILVRSADPVAGLLRADAAGAVYDAVFSASPTAGAGSVASSATSVEVAARANDGQPWVRTVAGAASSRWLPLDGKVTGTPDLARLADGTIVLVGRGLDGAAYLRLRTGGSWSGWTRLGGSFTSDLAVAAAGTRIDLAGRGLDGAIWHATVTGGSFGGWESLGGSLSSEPDLAAWAPGRLDVLARGLDGAMWHRAFEVTWQPWESLGGGFLTGPGATSVSFGTLHVAGVGLDGQVWQRAWTGASYTPWTALGGQLASSPDLTAWGPNNLDVYARASDQRVWRWRSTNGSVTTWTPVS